MIRKLCAAVLCVAVIGTSGADPVLPKAPPVRLAVVNSYGEALSVRYFSATVDAVVVRGDRTDLQTKGDLAGKDFAIVVRQAFAGWQVPAGDMIRQGLDPDHYFGSVTEVGMPMTNVLDAVKSGKADGGFVITCLLEELESEGKVKPGASG